MQNIIKYFPIFQNYFYEYLTYLKPPQYFVLDLELLVPFAALTYIVDVAIVVVELVLEDEYLKKRLRLLSI